MSLRNVTTRNLSARDRAVIELVAKFRQVRADHIQRVLFADRTSRTPLDRTLKRLVEGKYLMRLTRLLGGYTGGSEQYVYQLGRQGWRILGMSGNYWVSRAVNLHTLGIADCFVKLHGAEREGRLTLIDFVTEPDCHREVGPISLTPDAYVEIGNKEQHIKFVRFIEVDLGSEHRAQIRDKCVRYWHAFQLWDGDLYPRILFVVPDGDRAQFIIEIIETGPEAARGLFEVCTFDEFCLANIGDARNDNLPRGTDLS